MYINMAPWIFRFTTFFFPYVNEAHRLNLGNAEVCISSTTNHHHNNIKQLSFKYLVNTVSSFNLILIITLGEHCFPHIIDKKLILSKMKINDMIKHNKNKPEVICWAVLLHWDVSIISYLIHTTILWELLSSLKTRESNLPSNVAINWKSQALNSSILPPSCATHTSM